jgi:DNA-dependent RNA polymerase auxiliary subunit epsilon
MPITPHQPEDASLSTATVAPSVPAQAPGAPRQRGGVRITVEPAIDGPDVERFYALYLEAFGPLRTMAVARHVLHEDEFREEMVNPLIDKYVAWDEDGRAVAMATLTRHLETVPWISPEYFAHHYPEPWSRGAVFYLGFVLADPGRRRQRMFSEILAAVIRRVADARGICGWDACAFNVRHVKMRDVVVAVSQDVSPTEVEPIDSQTYFVSIPEASRNVVNLPQMRRNES